MIETPLFRNCFWRPSRLQHLAQDHRSRSRAAGGCTPRLFILNVDQAAFAGNQPQSVLRSRKQGRLFVEAERATYRCVYVNHFEVYLRCVILC